MKYRGQAFETMMLVISVIVAIAILGVLLGILGGIGGGFGSDSKDAIKDALKKLEAKGVGIETKENVDLNVGSALNAELVAGTAIDPSALDYHFDTSAFPTTAVTLITSGSGGYTVLKKAKGTLVVKKLSDKTHYSVCFGARENPSNTINTCPDPTT